MKVVFVTLFAILLNFSHADVWYTIPGLHWDHYWEKKFQTWIKDDVKGDFFKKLGEPYASLPLDCADAYYGLRIYFSYKHGLPWRSNAHTWQKKVYPNGFSNYMTDWDYLDNTDEKIAGLIRYLIGKLGTESLAALDTYPVALNDIKAGDIFMYKYGDNSSATRHTYIIKEVNTDGTFDVLYGTQLRAKKLWPLGRVPYEYLQHKPDRRNWGFKRMKKDTDFNIDQYSIIGASDEQYEIASRLTEEEFFDYVNVAARVHEESPTRKSRRLLNGICRALQARQIVVQDSIDWQNEYPGKCMNAADYDAYSTPSRDGGIRKKFGKLQKYFDLLVSREHLHRVKGGLKEVLQALFAVERSKWDNKTLENFCSIEVTDGVETLAVNIGSYFTQMEAGNISFHPNDNVFRRWGVDFGEKTRCETHYE